MMDFSLTMKIEKKNSQYIKFWEHEPRSTQDWLAPVSSKINLAIVVS